MLALNKLRIEEQKSRIEMYSPKRPNHLAASYKDFKMLSSCEGTLRNFSTLKKHKLRDSQISASYLES
jgi:hypothetical protein